jgi:hypothetical protein
MTTTSINIEHLQYPIGKFKFGLAYSETDFKTNIHCIRELPHTIKALTKSLAQNQLEKTYRPGGWNYFQVVHHIADSHMNGYTRIKFAVHEKSPVIKPYNADEWSLRPGEKFNIDAGVTAIEIINTRMANFLETLSADEYSRGYFHPEVNRLIPIIESAANYAHHGEHHLGHLKIIAGLK